MEDVPAMKLPQFSEQRFDPPDDFDSPYDMERYPELFNPKFVKWFFESEAALGEGKEAPRRPQAFWVPEKGSGVDDEEAEEDKGFSGSGSRRRKNKKGGGKWKAFGDSQ
jgi:hypothetical protein